MRKQILFLMLVALVFLAWHGAAGFSFSHQTNGIQKSNPIILQGQLKTGGFRSGTDPIVVEQQEGALFVRFQKNVGLLQVSVTGPQGEVYATAVDTRSPSALTVPLSGLPQGNYTITFGNDNGMMWGEFLL